MEEIVILVTVPSREVGERVAEDLVEQRVAACVNVVGPILSVYRWQGEVCRDDEHLLVIKSTRARYAQLEERVRSTHPYEVPEVIALPLEAGSAAYLAWLRAQVERSG